MRLSHTSTLVIALALAPWPAEAASAQEPARDSAQRAALDTTPARVPRQLEPVITIAERASGNRQLRGFYERRQRGNGYFLARHQIAPHDNSQLTDLLRARVPSVRVTGNGLGSARLRLRGQRCAPMVWIDGAPTPAAEFDIDVIHPSTVAAIEVYSGPGTVPVEFQMAMGRDGCGGTILIWSRRGGVDEDPDFEEAPAGPEVTLPVYQPAEVDERARVDSTGLVTPQYPDSLLAFAIEGSVVARLVVDTTGAPVAGSIEIVSASSPAFADAVARAVTASSFLPARRNGILVRQVLLVPFIFTPARP